MLWLWGQWTNPPAGEEEESHPTDPTQTQGARGQGHGLGSGVSCHQPLASPPGEWTLSAPHASHGGGRLDLPAPPGLCQAAVVIHPHGAGAGGAAGWSGASSG